MIMEPTRCPGSAQVAGVVAGRVELAEEEADPLGLVDFADLGGHLTETAKATEETMIRLVGPADVARATPAVRAERIEATVVSHTVRGVALDGVATVVAQCLPGDERSWVAGHEVGEPGTYLVGWRAERLLQFVPYAGVLERQHGAGRTLLGEMDGLIAHPAHPTA